MLSHAICSVQRLLKHPSTLVHSTFINNLLLLFMFTLNGYVAELECVPVFSLIDIVLRLLLGSPVITFVYGEFHSFSLASSVKGNDAGSPCYRLP